MTGTPSLSVLSELFRYNNWARDRQLQACQLLTEEQFLRPMESSFASIRDTLTHLVAAEWLWLEWWRGRSPRSILSPQQFPTLAVLSGRWRVLESEMSEYLATLGEDALAHPITYVDPEGGTWTHILWRTMLHLLQHQSYHRGQVATLLRQVGIHPPEVDFLTAHDLGFRIR